MHNVGKLRLKRHSTTPTASNSIQQLRRHFNKDTEQLQRHFNYIQILQLHSKKRLRRFNKHIQGETTFQRELHLGVVRETREWGGGRPSRRKKTMLQVMSRTYVYRINA